MIQLENKSSSRHSSNSISLDSLEVSETRTTVSAGARCLNELVEEFVESVRTSGKKALQLIESKTKSDLVLAYETEKESLASELRMKESRLTEAQNDFSKVQLIAKKRAKQLALLAKAFANSRKRDDLAVTEAGLTVAVWRRLRHRVNEYVKERSSQERLCDAFYRCKMVGKIFHKWHTRSVKSGVLKLKASELKSIESAHSAALQASKEETQNLQNQLESLRCDLVEESRRRERVQEDMKLFMISKLEEGFGSVVEKPTAGGLAVTAPPVKRPLSAAPCLSDRASLVGFSPEISVRRILPPLGRLSPLSRSSRQRNP